MEKKLYVIMRDGCLCGVYEDYWIYDRVNGYTIYEVLSTNGNWKCISYSDADDESKEFIRFCEHLYKTEEMYPGAEPYCEVPEKYRRINA